MNKKIQRKARNIILAVLLVYVSAGILLYLFQDLLLFHPTPLEKDYAFRFDEPFNEINIPVKERNLNIVTFKPAAETKGIVLFFHGNMNNVEHYKKYPAFFLMKNYEVWMPDYPGFGKSTGKRSEQNMYHDALMIYEEARKKMPAEQIIIYGKSIGTGVASYTASMKPCKLLILESPYYSIDALAKSYVPFYPVSPMTRYTFPVNHYLKNTGAPVTIFHGTNDEVIPFSHATRLKEENKNVALVGINEGKHNDLSSFPEFRKKLDSLLN